MKDKFKGTVVFVSIRMKRIKNWNNELHKLGNLASRTDKNVAFAPTIDAVLEGASLGTDTLQAHSRNSSNFDIKNLTLQNGITKIQILKC